MTIYRTTIDALQVVFNDQSSSPLMGLDSLDGVYTFAPWKWDQRIWTDERFENMDLAVTIPADQVTYGLEKSFWQSGVGSTNIDLMVDAVTKVRQNSEERWSVKIRHGNYFRYRQHRYLFGDGSETQYVSFSENVSSRNVLDLTRIPRHSSPIEARMWRRMSFDQPDVYLSIYKRMQFTGTYSESGEADTEGEDGSITWANVDTNKKEFVVKWDAGTDAAPTLYFNRDYTKLIGPDTVADDDDLQYCEYVGRSNGTNSQIFYTEFFPIDSSVSVELYDDAQANLLVEDTDFVIDYDRGEITFPTSLPNEPPLPDSELYIKYRATLEVEYEPEFCKNTCTAPYIELNPLNSQINKGFIYLTEEELRVAYLVLTADATLISEGLYGPVNLGSGYCRVTATAYTITGVPVPGAEVSFYLSNSTDGRINGSIPVSEPVIATTDENGEATVIFTAPRSVESIGQYVTSHPYGNDLTLTSTVGITADTLSEVFTYGVYDTDSLLPWTGTSGGKKIILAEETAGAINPNDPYDVTVWAPIRPVSIAGNVLTYAPLVTLPATVPSGGLVAYWVAAGRTVPISASCFSYLYNTTISASDIELSLTIPEHMKGTYINESDNEVIYGFRLIDELSHVASSLNGVTFLDVNSDYVWPGP